MREMKDSGIEWIGQIPKEWEVIRIKRLFSESKERTLRDNEGQLLTLSQYTGVSPRSDSMQTGMFKAESTEGYNVVHAGQLVMNIMLAWNGSYALSGYDGIISPAYVVYNFNIDCCKKYFHYLLRLEGYQEAFKTVSHGIVDSRLRLYPIYFYQFLTLFPSLAEQEAIAAVLDRKCGEIDELIMLQEEMISELEEYRKSVISETVTRGLNPDATLRPTGIQWLGEIPANWKISPLKYLLSESLMYGANESPEGLLNIDNPRYIRITDITENGNLRQDTYCSLAWGKARPYILQYGDILFARSGATVGKTYRFAESYPCCFASYLIKASLNNSLDSKFFQYFTNSFCYQNWKNSIFIQSTIQNISAEKYNLLPTPLPPISEQREIAEYLDKKCAEIDALIAVKREKIDALKEYKKSIIFEYVTGKKAV